MSMPCVEIAVYSKENMTPMAPMCCIMQSGDMQHMAGNHKLESQSDAQLQQARYRLHLYRFSVEWHMQLMQ